MKIEIKGGILQLSHFSIWGLFMWLFSGIIFISIGITFLQETVLGRIFLLLGILTLMGSFLLKKISVVFDKNTNTVKRCWQSWTGIFKKLNQSHWTKYNRLSMSVKLHTLQHRKLE